jgi:hypothetical protein
MSLLFYVKLILGKIQASTNAVIIEVIFTQIVLKCFVTVCKRSYALCRNGVQYASACGLYTFQETLSTGTLDGSV